MSFITGLMLIDAPASALNNRGEPIEAKMYENEVAIKAIYSGGKTYPYVSAQAFRYWLRTTLDGSDLEWNSAPVYRDSKIAYTSGDPIQYWDDDLFGYMRAPGSSSKKERKASEAYAKLTPLDDDKTITRVSPFRVSTLVSINPVRVVKDQEVNSRGFEGHSVPYSSQFYRATLQGLFSLDLRSCGTFSYLDKTGYRNLDETRKQKAEAAGLDHDENEKTYQLPSEERVKRVTALMDGLARVEGGAKQALHYTDVSPVVTLLAVTKGGNHIFGHVIGAGFNDLPIVKLDALQERLEVFSDEILSDIYIGWVKGYADEERARLERALEEDGQLAKFKDKIKISHPRKAFEAFNTALRNPENTHWFD